MSDSRTILGIEARSYRCLICYNALMNDAKTIFIDAYPWPQPTEAQKAYFDGLPPEARRRLLEAAIEEGFNSGLSEKSTEELRHTGRLGRKTGRSLSA